MHMPALVCIASNVETDTIVASGAPRRCCQTYLRYTMDSNLLGSIKYPHPSLLQWCFSEIARADVLGPGMRTAATCVHTHASLLLVLAGTRLSMLGASRLQRYREIFLTADIPSCKMGQLRKICGVQVAPLPGPPRGHARLPTASVPFPICGLY